MSATGRAPVPPAFGVPAEPVSGALGSGGRCRDCPEWIAFAITTSGARMPINRSPAETGNLAVERVSEGPFEGAYRVSVLAPSDVPKGDRYMPHHATCPAAGKWRRGRR